MYKKITYTILLILIHWKVNAQTADVLSGCVPLQVNFSAPAGATSFYWDFKDGASAIVQNPSNLFITPGTYLVEFRASAVGSVLGTVQIKVYPKPTPQILLDSNIHIGCKDFLVNFKAVANAPAGVNISGYNWTFGDGYAGNGIATSHTYILDGFYNVGLELMSTTPSCNVTLLKDSFVVVSGFLGEAFGSPLVGCTKPQNVNFNNQLTNLFPIKTYHWSFGDGTFSTLKTPPTKVYIDTGSFRLQLIATDTFGCKYTYDTMVKVANFQASFAMPDTFCLQDTVTLVGTPLSGAAYFWNTPNATYNSSTNNSSTDIHYAQIGVYPITFYTVIGSCIKSKTKSITVIDPVIRIQTIPDTLCSKNFSLKLLVLDSNLVTSINWYLVRKDTVLISQHINDVVQITNQFDSIAWSFNASICAKVLTRFGCSLTVCKAVDFPTVAHVEPSETKGCAPLLVTFFNKTFSVFPSANWTLDFGDGSRTTLLSSVDSQLHIYTSPGKYPMRIWTQTVNGCADTSYLTWITVGAKPHPNFSVNKSSICAYDSILTTNLSPASDSLDQWHYWADNLTNNACGNLPNNTIKFAHQAGWQNIQLEVGSDGCLSDTSMPVFVNGPLAKYRFKQYCDSIYTVDFINLSQLSTRFLYDFGDGTTSTQPNPRHTYNKLDNIYAVKLIAYNDTNTCTPDTFLQQIVVNKPFAKFAMDSNFCKGEIFSLDASASSGMMGTGCKYNFTWLITPPNRTASSSYLLQNIDTGTYHAGVVVENSIGCKDTAYQNFRVHLFSGFIKSSDSLLCLPQRVSFKAHLFSEAKIDSIYWSFGDGTTQSGTDSVSHYYTNTLHNSDTIFVFFYARDSFGCVFTYRDTLFTYHLNTQISINKNILCQGDTLKLSASNTSNLNLKWLLENGKIDTFSSVNYVYKDTAGLIAVQLTYTDKDNPVCTHDTLIQINIHKKPHLAIVTGNDQTQEYCFPLSVNLKYLDSTQTGANNIDWILNHTTHYYLDSVAITFPKGNNFVSLIVTDSVGCADTVSRVFNVIGPKGDFIIDTNHICVNDHILFTLKDTTDVYSYKWDFGDGTISIDTSPISHTYKFVPNGGQTQAKLTVSGPGGFCPNSVQKTIFLKQVFADFIRNMGDTSICFGQKYILQNTSQGADSYFWDFGNGTNSTQKEVGEFIYTKPGEYFISLQIKNNQYGCKDTVTKPVIVYPKPTAAFQGDTICLGALDTLFAQKTDTGLQYNWQPTSILNPSNKDTTMGQFLGTTWVSLIVSTNKGCKDTSHAWVYVIQPPQEIIFDTILPLGSSVILPFIPQFGYQYNWQPDTGLSCYNCSNPVRDRVLFKQIYTLTFKDTLLGCFVGKSSYTIDVYPTTFLKLPNTFTPNGDGENDVVYVEGWGIKKLLFFRIYNRWNELVFESNDLQIGWDGRYKNQIQNDDIYQYKAEGLDYFDKHLVQEGFIHLMH